MLNRIFKKLNNDNFEIFPVKQRWNKTETLHHWADDKQIIGQDVYKKFLMNFLNH